MLKIRLQRVGRRHDPKFRVIVTDARRGPKSGKFIEKLGFYDAKMGTIELNAERIQYWLSVGAQASDTIHNFLVAKGIVEGKKVNALPKKTAPKKEEAVEEVKEEKAEEAPAEESAPAEEAPSEEEKTEEVPVEEKKEEEAEESAE